MAVLEVAHDLARHRRLAAQRAAQLADDALRARLVQVDLLAGQRRAPAVGAAVAVGLQGADAAAQQHALELLDMALRVWHVCRIRRRARLLPVLLARRRRRGSTAPR